MNLRYGFIFVLMLLMLFSFQGIWAQTYVSNQVIGGGNPGGINTTSDATTTGWTQVTNGGESVNEWSAPQALPFAFDFFGTPVTHFMVSLNMVLTFDTTATVLPGNNTNLPTASLPDMAIANYWDEFTVNPPIGTTDRVWTMTFGTAPNRQFWIKWYSFEYGNASFAYNSIVLEETTNSVYLVDMYSSGTVTSTAGVQMNNTTAYQFGDDMLPLGSNGSSNTDNDYIEFYVPPPVDMAVTEFLNLPSVAVANSSVNFDVVVSNLGADPFAGGSLDIYLNGGFNSTLSVGALNSGETDTVAASVTASASGRDSVVAALQMVTGDADLTNDTLSTAYDIQVPVSSYPYNEAFENAGSIPADWTNDPLDSGKDWDFGTSTTYGADFDHTSGSGYFAYLDDSTPNPTDGTNLITPYFDLTSLTAPTLSFWYWSYNEDTTPSDSSWLHVDVWDGSTWNNDVIPAIGSEIQQWQIKIIDLTPYQSAASRVRFRIIESSEFYHDISLDDVGIGEPAPDLAVTSFLNVPASPAPSAMYDIDVRVSNAGGVATPAADLDLYFNGAFSSTSSVAALGIGESDTVTFSITTSATGTDTLTAALQMLAGDLNQANDTLTTTYDVAGVETAPYFEHFDSTTAGTPGTFPPGWVNATDDDHDWYVESSGTQNSTSTGPLNDHSGTGNYVYVESSSPYFNVTAHLLSPYFDLTGMTAPTVEFWFHMYGQTMGDLHFDVWSSGTGWVNDVRPPLVGEYQTSETDPWLRSGIDLSAFIGSVVQVRFRGITGPNFYSDMSIDDVTMDEYSNLTPFPDEISAGIISMPLFTKMPLTQTGIVSAVNFEGSFSNLGFSNTGDINVEVTNSSTVYSNSTTGVTIPSFGSSTFSFGPWDASAAPADQYDVLMYSSNFTGVNDTSSHDLELGETMAWDHGVISTNISYNGAEEVKIGARFTLTDPDTLTSVTMMLSTSTVATDSFAVDIYSVANDTPDVMLARLFEGTYGDFGTPPVLAIFPVPGGGMAMPAGDFYAMIVTPTPSAASYPIGADGTGLGASALTHRFVARGATSDWLFFEDAGNAAFHTLTPIIRTGYQEILEIHDFAVDSMVVDQVCMTEGETYNVAARIRNVGNEPEGFTTIEFYANGLFAGDDFVNSLDPGQSAAVSFPYSPTGTGVVKLDVISRLVGDGNAANDTATTYVRVTDHDIVFVDDFEDTTFTFANWVIVDDPTTTGTWMIYPPPYPNAYTLPVTSSGNVAAADADEAGSGSTTITTAMLPLDLSGYDSVFVDFDSDWHIFDAQDTARVNVSNDGGATWTTVLEYAGVDSQNQHVSLDLTQYLAGSANAVIAAESVQPGWDWWWAIDNVCVSGVMGTTPPPVIYEEVFPDTSIPAGWLVVDNDGSGFAYEFRQQVIFTSGDTVNPESGQSFWFSNYTNANSSGLIDEWLISPKIYASSLNELTVYAGAIGGSFPDSLKIWVSTTGNDLNSFTNLVGYFLVDGPIGSWHPYTFDISQFSGNDIYVAVNYYIEDGGPTGNNSDNVWVDHIKVTGQPGAPPAAKLLITEIVVTPTSGEFVEIYNPNNESVNLSNFYLTDATFAGDGTYYYKIVEGGGGGGGFGDFDARFPAGAMIGPKEHQTVALAGDSAFFDTYGVMPTYELYEDGHANPADAPDMLEAVPGSINNQGGLTNGDEVVILYYWDNLSDLVVDVDYLLYNSGSPTANDEAVDKTGVSIDGPDAGTDSSMYLPDTPIASQVSALNHSSGSSTQRLDYTEGTQTMSGGNGVTGADETSEDLNNTFTNAYAPTPNDSLIVVGIEDNPLLPLTFAISQNYPNPFNPTTSIKYQLPQTADVTVTIYNLLGQKVRTLVNDRKEAGFYEVEWNGLNDHNVQVATGLYIYRIQAADFVQSKKMLLLK